MERSRNRKFERPKSRLVRGVDGRLRSADGESGIGDVWADQKRIRLAEAILEDKQKAQKRETRQRLLKRLKSKLPVRRREGGGANEFVLQLEVPSLKLPLFLKRRPSKKVLIVGVSALVFGVVALVVFGMGDEPAAQLAGEKPSSKVVAEVLDSTTENPPFVTLTPEGKGVDQLGGWRRVSPPEAPIATYAFTDTIDGVQVTVSEQPLPESFKQDISGSLLKLAEQFTANEKVTAHGVTAYIGTSEKGPQSAILAKHDLLVLIKSTQKISNDYWGVYLSNLK